MDGKECDTEEEIDEDQIVSTVASGDMINCIDDDANEIDIRPNTRSRRNNKNSNKGTSAVSIIFIFALIQ